MLRDTSICLWDVKQDSVCVCVCVCVCECVCVCAGQYPQGYIYSGWIQDFPNGGRCFVTNGGAHILFSGKKCMKLKEIGLKWGAHVF